MDDIQAIQNCLAGDHHNAIGRIFDRIETADRVINTYAHKHPDKADLLNALFQLFQSPIVDTYKPLILFHTHCQQLAQAIVTGVDLNRPTMMEVAVMTCKLSELAPPITELSLLILSDEATMNAFGLNTQPAPLDIGNHLWDNLTHACRQIYIKAYGKTRSA